MTQPASVTSDGMVKTVWVPSGGIASAAAPTVAELTAGTVKDFSGYFTDTGWAPTPTEDTVTSPRLNSTQTYNAPGRSAATIELIYVTNPEVPADDVAALTLTNRATGYLVERRGLADSTAFTVGDLVTVYPVTLGIQKEGTPTANTDLTIAQTAYVRAPGVYRRVAVA